MDLAEPMSGKVYLEEKEWKVIVVYASRYTAIARFIPQPCPHEAGVVVLVVQC
jgi:hypothetical protein